jgi:hypothetical protein
MITALNTVAVKGSLIAQNVLLAQGPIRDWNEPGQDPNNSGCIVDGVPTIQCAEIVFGNLVFMATALVGVVLFIMFLIGGFKYLTSLGDADKMQEAKNTFTYAVIGLVLFVSAALILFLIDALLLGGKGEIFNFKLGV